VLGAIFIFPGHRRTHFDGQRRRIEGEVADVNRDRTSGDRRVIVAVGIAVGVRIRIVVGIAIIKLWLNGNCRGAPQMWGVK